jgi:hypothetical protein
MESAAYLISTSKTKFHGVIYGVFKVFVVWHSLKPLCSRVLASFAGHRCLSRFLASFRWTTETAMTSFQLKEYVWSAIDPTRRLVHH